MLWLGLYADCLCSVNLSRSLKRSEGAAKNLAAQDRPGEAISLLLSEIAFALRACVEARPPHNNFRSPVNFRGLEVEAQSTNAKIFSKVLVLPFVLKSWFYSAGKARYALAWLF
jgi:hypothetical protein